MCAAFDMLGTLDIDQDDDEGCKGSATTLHDPKGLRFLTNRNPWGATVTWKSDLSSIGTLYGVVSLLKKAKTTIAFRFV